MRYLRLYIALCLVCCTALVAAQDIQALGSRDIMGTARYVGMAGAMTAVGGDPSAVGDNPAALGVYRHIELSFSSDLQIDFVRQHGQQGQASSLRYYPSQFSWVFAFGDDTRTRGLIYSNLMLSFRHLRSFSRTFSTASDASVSLAQVAQKKTEGLHCDALFPEDRWENLELGWLSIMAFDTYLISPETADSTKWIPVTAEGEDVRNALTVVESGHVNQYSIHWAGNINNRLFLGLGLNLQSLSYNRDYTSNEVFRAGKLTNTASALTTGIGVSGSVGVIWHPVQLLRLGASFETPAIHHITTTTYGKLSTLLEERGEWLTISNSCQLSDNAFKTPLRLSLGAALQFTTSGLLSAQYDYAHSRGMYDVHTLKLGAEYNIRGWYLNAGYACESSFRKTLPAVELAYNSVRTDLYSRYERCSHYASAGFGYRGRWGIAQVAYQFRWQNVDFYAHELAPRQDLDATTHRVTLTLAWHR